MEVEVPNHRHYAPRRGDFQTKIGNGFHGLHPFHWLPRNIAQSSGQFGGRARGEVDLGDTDNEVGQSGAPDFTSDVIDDIGKDETCGHADCHGQEKDPPREESAALGAD